MIVYLDDILFMDLCPLRLHRHLQLTVDLLQNLGFVINDSKSVLSPSQTLQFLGFIIDSSTSTLSLATRKVTKIWHELRRTLSRAQVSLRDLARIVGLLSASIQAIFPGPLHYRALHRLKASYLRQGCPYSHKVALSGEARHEIQWWLQHMEAWNGRAIFGSTPDLIIESDASTLGWGARCGEFSTGGLWSPQRADYISTASSFWRALLPFDAGREIAFSRRSFSRWTTYQRSDASTIWVVPDPKLSRIWRQPFGNSA